MNNKEKILIKSLEHIRNKQSAGMIIATFINMNGPLSEECAEQVRHMLEEMK